MKRVLMVGPELTPIPPIHGGATENWIENVCRRIGRYRCTVVGPTDPELPAREVRGGVEYVRLAPGRIRRRISEWLGKPDCSYVKRVFAGLGRWDPDVIHVQNRPLAAAYLRRKVSSRVPVVLQMHNLYDYLGRYERPETVSPVPLDAFLAVSRFVLERERERLGLGARRAGVLPNGVDTDLFTPEGDPSRVEVLERRYDLENRRVVLYTGKLREGKGVSLLVEALKRVFARPDMEDVVLLLVGGPHFGRGRSHRKTDYYRELTASLSGWEDRVRITGFVSPFEMHHYYPLGTVYAAPSQLEEGCPSVLLEAMSAGLPVVSTPVGGVPEVVDSGRTGVVLRRRDDPEELAGVLVELLEDPARRRMLGSRARREVVQRFSWEVVARRTEALYDELLGA